MGRDDDLVALSDAGGTEADRKRRGAGGDPHALGHAALRGPSLLEPLHLLAEDEGAAADDPLERFRQLYRERCVLTIEGGEGDLRAADQVTHLR